MTQQVQLFCQYHEEGERHLHDQPGIYGLQGIWDNGFTCFVLYRGDVGCPENRSDIDK